MPSGREYVRLYADLASNPKWGRLPMVLRGVWATLLVYAASRNEPSFTVEQATWLLKREGERQAVKRIEALVERRWLDRVGDTLSIHQWHDHQPVYRGPSDSAEAKAARNALRPTTPRWTPWSDGERPPARWSDR